MLRSFKSAATDEGDRMKAINIKWDVTDSKEDMTQEEIEECLSKLPTEVAIPEWIDTKDEDAVSDWLSEEYEYCHYGFEICSDI